MSSYILGLDLGVQSIGWAIIPRNPKKGPEFQLGVRCFDSGTGTESEIEQGKDESRKMDKKTKNSQTTQKVMLASKVGA